MMFVVEEENEQSKR